MGKKGPLAMKSRTRVLWEQQLHKTKLSNDDICDVFIKRAMEGVPLNAPLVDIVEENTPPATKKSKVESPVAVTKDSSSESGSDSDDEDGDISLKQVKLSITRMDEELPISKPSTSTKSNDLLEGLEPLARNKKTKTYSRKSQNQTLATVEDKPVSSPETRKSKTSLPDALETKAEPTVVVKPKEVTPPPKPKITAPPFNIMDHILMIKVNGVGILYQCRLCIRNFLKKDMVINHGCAKNSAPPKETNSANAALPEPPKASTVKYIQMNKHPNKPLSSLVDKTVEKLNPPTGPPSAPPTVPHTVPPQVPPKPVEPEVKPKPKVGPASRTRPKPELPREVPIQPAPPKPTPEIPSTPSSAPLVNFPNAPSLNSRYKLVPGPNNTFQLVEESVLEEKPVQDKPVQEKIEEKLVPKTRGSKRMNESDTSKSSSSKPKHHREPLEKSSSPEIIVLDENKESQKAEPYPVGLFQPVPHHSSVYPPTHTPVPFTTPAMKKHSYSIVQTGNPSKLLISTKPQPVPEEVPRKKSKKKTEEKDKEPYKVTLEDAARQKDPSLFAFVSLDPLLQPSYVLPTNNIIQESQITTSTPGAKPAVDKEKDKYPCNMCGETFSREKKLLSHIQSHYNQMDEEDERRVSKPGPRKSKKLTHH